MALHTIPDAVHADAILGAEAEALDQALLAAHDCRDAALLARLYARAADLADASGDATGAGFYLTHAYVFALETGAAEALTYRSALIARGREN